MQKKESTPIRVARRKYEEKNKEKRDAASKVWGTSLPTELADEINEFLFEHRLSKVDLIKEGYKKLKKKIEKEKHKKQRKNEDI